jgi:hypothetical protein
MLKSRMRDDSSEMLVQLAETTWNKGGFAGICWPETGRNWPL